VRLKFHDPSADGEMKFFSRIPPMARLKAGARVNTPPLP